MGSYGVALDLGTSGIRGQAVDLDSGEIISTAITGQHPLPGGNVMDHLHFSVECTQAGSASVPHDLLVDSVNKVVQGLGVPREEVERVAICGNPIQLSLFQSLEVRDLAYAGKSKLESIGVSQQVRGARIGTVGEIHGLELPEDAVLVVPPAVRHEVGADALAMMLKSGMLERDEVALVTDYGTNAEMALKVGDQVVTGSAACGPAFEGQAIAFGMLAVPGAICDLERVDGGYRNLALDEDMMPEFAATVDPRSGVVRERGSREVCGITGTGVMAALALGLQDGFVKLPKLDSPDGRMHLGGSVVLGTDDVIEVGKAVGAARAGHVTLAQELGIKVEDIKVAYMAGASGTYVDARKAQAIGMVPASVERMYQIGNTSLMLARDMVSDPDSVWKVEEIAQGLRAHHSMFAEAKVFKDVYILELGYWTEGMPWDMYRKFMDRAGVQPPKEFPGEVEVIRIVDRDIPDLGSRGLRVVTDVGMQMLARFEGCTDCGTCRDVCPEKAITFTEDEQGERLVHVASARCLGVSCLQCEISCPDKVFDFGEFINIV